MTDTFLPPCPMALNIKNDEAHDLARKLADASGTSLTEAVTTALRQSLDRDARSDDAEILLREVRALQQFVADLPDRDRRSPEEILGYDEAGLPS